MSEAPLVLIVDDAPDNREAYAEYLRFRGFRTVEAATGTEAIEMARTHVPDVVLLDWNMPVMSGIEFIVQLRQHEGGDKPKVVFCTTENDVAHIRQAISAGADEYVMKPFDHETLQIKLQLVGFA